MSDLIASNLEVSFGAETLFHDVSLTVDPGDRIALVGPNGAGKTTLLRVLAGALTPTSGTVQLPDHLTVALHDQRPERTPQLLSDYVAPARMVALEADLRRLEQEMADGDEAIMREWQDVRARYDALGGEGWVVRADTVLRGLGFHGQQLAQPLDTLSGGELTRASLARALAAAPDVLLLDEPTNHLDMESIDWLQEFITDLPGGLVLVSHDRWFIESTCTSVVEIVGGKARRFNGSFVEYRTQQALEAVTFQRQVERWKDEVARLQRFVDRFSAGTRARQAQSRVKALDRLKAEAPAYADLRQRRTVGFSLPVPERSGATVLDIRGIELGFDADPATGVLEGRTLLAPTDLVVERGEKVALLGRNGTGKSTLLHAIAAACLPLVKPPDAQRGGEIRVGYSTSARLLSQHDSELVDNQSMLGNMRLAAPTIATRDALALLGLFGFTGDDGEQLVGTLSGGERRRLLLAMALTGSANLLLLDEPTNHLDLEGREALEAAIAEFEGTVILISHDRALVEGVATRTVVLHDQTVTTAVGGYTQARAMLTGEDAKPATSQEAAKPAVASPATADGGRKVSAGTARTQRGGGRRDRRTGRGDGIKVRRPGTIERELEQLEARLAEVQQLMLDPEVYTSPERSGEALAEHERLERDITRGYEELERSLEHFG